MFSHVRTLLHHELQDYSLGQIAAAFPGKHVVNKRLQTSIIIMLAPVIF